MRINKKQLEMLLSLPDDTLIKALEALGNSSGFDISGINLTPENLTSIRNTVRNMSEDEINRAADILKNFKKS